MTVDKTKNHKKNSTSTTKVKKKKAKRQWHKGMVVKDQEIKFINPEKPAAAANNASSKSVPLNTNWENLKKVLAESKCKSKSEKDRNRKTGPKLKKTSDHTQPDNAETSKVNKRKATCAGRAGRKRRHMSDKVSSTEKKTDTKPPRIWFDDVDPCLLEPLTLTEPEPVTTPAVKEVEPAATSAGKPATTTPAATEKQHKKSTKAEAKLVKPASFDGLTNAVAMDCEMVGVDKTSILARVSIVNLFGHCVYDTFVRPTEKVTDYRTHVSGVRPRDLKDAPSFDEVQKKVFAIVDKRILVGHALWHDLRVLFLSHPRKLIRDTARYSEFRKLFNGRMPSLKNLTEKVLGVRIQSGEHSSVEDARAAMRLYTMYKVQWEKELRASQKNNKLKTGKGQKVVKTGGK